jgi:tetratricopeptide (TPR) repeat protein
LDAYEEHDLELLGRTLVELGEMAEDRDHHHGSLELYRCAYEITAAIGAPEPAAAAARLSGRLLRRRARWDEANAWYDAAHAIASAARLDDLAARALSGLAVIKKEMGNLPAARDFFHEALEVAERSGALDTVAAVHGGLLGLEQAAGNLRAALDHGWVAVEVAESEVARTRCLATLAGALGDYGDREAAQDAWTVVAHTSKEKYYRIYAHDALAYLAAERGDAEGFDSHATLCDDLDWENGPRSAKAEILYYRGLSYRALGRLLTAEAWLERAIAFAEEHSFNQLLFDAEAALEALTTHVEERNAPSPSAPLDVREGVRAMRQGLVSV